MKISLRLRRRLLAGLFLCLAAAAALAVRVWLDSPGRGLPYRDSFAGGKADEWSALGGTWELVNGVMRNDSDERGAKLLTGSPSWRNYSIEADLSLLGPSGDAGLLIRSSNEEEGVNAYSGYYAGVRTSDNSLVLGRADHGWMEVTRPLTVPHGIHPFQWYHLKLLAWNCRIVAAVSLPGQPAQTTLGINDQRCTRSGRVGLRSYSSGGTWRNILVRSASREDLEQMLRSRGTTESTLRPPSSQDPGFWEMRQQQIQQQELRQERAVPPAMVQSISSLRLTSFARPVTATIRGVIVLTTPRLYVQDSTGGVYVPQSRGPVLKVGDEVEVTGQVHPGDFSSSIDPAVVQVLWARTPMPPVSITASQAATGKYDATFIELRGVLTSKERGPDNSLILDLDQGPQSFRAIMNPGRSDALFGTLRPDSVLRLRGICVVDPALTHNLTSFVLLLRSNEDLDVIAGPPWWTTRHIVALAIGSMLLVLIGVILYHRVENWRLRAILDERGRLAHEIHDTLAQSFAGIGFQLQAIRNGLPRGMPALDQQLELARDLVRHSHEEARRSIAALHTESLESEDIPQALRECARRMVGGGAVEVTAEREGDSRALPLRTMDTLYRIGQEAIANAIRHANPTRLKIRMAYGARSVTLEIEDDGSGFVPGAGLSGFGIRGMRRRAQSVSAIFHLDSKPGVGTRIRVDAPIPPRITLASWPGILWKYIRE